MSLHVQKYGGTSLATIECIERIADRVARTRASGTQVVVVVSAMGETTDQLLDLAHQVSRRPTKRELDMLLTAGERISMALLSMALHERGVAAISFTGSQSGILTDTWHGAAHIREIRATRLREALAEDRVVIVAGFQGVSAQREVTTLGRGGSDTTAVALAVALDAEQCDICTDVDGVFTADPRRVPGARRLERISYEEMLTLATHGAQVLHPRAADLAARFRVRLRVCSSFEEGGGTMVETSDGLEPARIQGVTSDENVALLRLDVPPTTAFCAAVFDSLAQLGLTPRDLVQTPVGDGARLCLLVPRSDAEAVAAALQRTLQQGGGGELVVEHGVTRVSLVGHALQTPGVAARVLGLLARNGIELRCMQSDSLTLSGLVRDEELAKALQVLHEEVGPLPA